MENTNSKMHKNDNSYVLSALSYLSIFLHLLFYLYLYGYLLMSQHQDMVKALGNHIMTWISFCVGRGIFIFQKESLINRLIINY